MKKPYRLFKRRPQNIWYYRLPDKPTGHSTGQKSRAKAEEYVISILNGSLQQLQPQTTLGAFAADFFVKGCRCPCSVLTFLREMPNCCS